MAVEALKDVEFNADDTTNQSDVGGGEKEVENKNTIDSPAPQDIGDNNEENQKTKSVSDEPIIDGDVSFIATEQETDFTSPLQADVRSVGAEKRTSVDADKLSEMTGKENVRMEDLKNLPKLRAQSQGFLEEVGKASLKFVPQTIAQFGELAGYIGDIQAYDDVFRGLANYASKKSTGETVMEEDYEDVGNWLSEVSRNANTSIDKLLPIYRDDPSKVWAPGDSAWWVKNIGNLGETVAAFGGISGVVRAGLGGLLKAGASAARTGAAVNTLRGGAQLSKAADYGTVAGTAISTGYAEGMLVGMQNYEKTYQKKRQQLEQEGISPEEADRRAKEAAGQAAATTAGINSVILPFLNLTGAATMVRSGRNGKRLTNEALEIASDEGFENIDKVAQRISDTPAGTNLVSREARDLGRESVLESAEELSARISEVEGSNIDNEDAPDVGDRLSEALFSPQSALEATLGAIAGAGQQGIMRSLPTIEDPQGEGRISRRQLEWQRDAEWASKEKEDLKERVRSMTKAKDLLNQAKNTDDEVEAQQLRDKAMTKIRTSITADTVSRGVSHQLKGIYQGIANMDSDRAESLGFDTDPESDNYYKDIAEEEAERIDKYQNEYQELQNQYDFGTQEEFAGVPKTLLNLRIQEDNARRRSEDLKSQKRDLEDQVPSDEEFERQARLDVERDLELQNLQEQQEAIRGLRDSIENLGIESFQDKTFGEIEEQLEGSQFQSELDQAREALPNELFESLRNLKLQDAVDFAEYTINKRQSRVDELNNKKTEAYQSFLDRRNLEDNQDSRRAFQLFKDQIRDEYKKQYDQLNKAESYAELKADVARKRYNYFTSSDGRQQLVDRVKGFHEEVREKSLQEVESRINNASTEGEVDNILDSYPELISSQMQNLAEQRKEEIRTSEREIQESDRMDPDSETAEQDAESIAERMNNQAKTAEEVAREEQQQEEDTEEESTGFGDQLADMAGLGIQTEEATTETEDQTSFAEGVAEETGPQDVQTPQEILRDGVNAYVDNRSFENEEQAEKNIEEFIDQKVSSKDTLKRALNENEGLKESLIRQGVDRYKTNKSYEEMRDETEEDTEEDITEGNQPLENVEDQKDDMDSSEEVDGDQNPKPIESGSVILYRYGRSENIEGDEDVSRESIEYEPIESSKELLPGDEIEYRVLSRQEAENQGFDQESLENSTFREDVDMNSINSAAVGIYRNGSLVGYLRTPDSINEDTTATNIEGVSDNVEKNKALNRGIRRSVVDQLVNHGNLSTPGKVTKKWPGHLSINRDENGNKEFQKLEDGFPDQDIQFFVIRNDEKPYIKSNQSLEYDELLNNESYFNNNVGTAGVLVTMGNGEQLAVPIWLPRLNEIDQEGENTVETINQIALQGQEAFDGNIEGQIDILDLSDPDTVEKQLGNYVYTTDINKSLSGIHSILQSEGKRKIHIVSNEDGTAIINQKTREVYHTNEEIVRVDDEIESWQKNQDKVKDLIGQMRFNIDLDKINQDKDPNDFPEKILTVDENGDLTTQEYHEYNDFAAKYAETDIDASYSITNTDGETEYLAYEHPTVNTEVAIGEDRSTTPAPNPPVSRGGDAATTSSSQTTSTRTDDEISDEEDSEVQGDTEDVRTADVNTKSNSDSEFNSSEDVWEYFQVSGEINNTVSRVQTASRQIEQGTQGEIDSETKQGQRVRERREEARTELEELREEKIEKFGNSTPSVSQIEQMLVDIIRGNVSENIQSKATRAEYANQENIFGLYNVLGGPKSVVTPIQRGLRSVYNQVYSSFDHNFAKGQNRKVWKAWLDRVYEKAENQEEQIISTVEDPGTLFTEEIEDPSDQQLRQLAQRIEAQEDPVLTDAEEQVYEENQERVDELREEVRLEAEGELQMERFQERYDEIKNTRTNQSDEDLQQAINNLNDLLSDMEDQGIGLENDLYEDAKIKRSDLQDELAGRGEISSEQDNTQEGEVPDDVVNDALKGLGFDQDLEQNTYTPDAVLVKDIEISSNPVDNNILKTQIDEDISKGKLNIKCKT